MPEQYTCTTCRLDKPATDYHRERDTLSSPWRRRTQCKLCHNAYNAKQRRDKRKQVRALNPPPTTKRNPERIAQRFRLTPTQRAAHVTAQAGLCAICKQPPGRKGLHTDHNHRTNEFRALLCGACNVGIGMFRDDPALLTAAIAYLAAHDA